MNNDIDDKDKTNQTFVHLKYTTFNLVNGSKHRFEGSPIFVSVK